MYTGSSKNSARQKTHGVTTGQRTDLFRSATLTCLFSLSRTFQGRYRVSGLWQQSEAMTICVLRERVVEA
jgi:Tfp pilus assembly ATPase PilU